MLKEKMATYAGQPISAVIAKLGHPTTEQTIAGAKVYTWTTYRIVEATSYDCKIRAIVDARDVITTWDVEGNQRGCAYYASMLNR